MADVRLNWATAEVEDGRLTVDLEGEIPKGWRDSFETTVRLLGHGEWGKVRVKKQTVRVSEVVPGSEEKLRHHLESVLAQANADHPGRSPTAATRTERTSPPSSPTRTLPMRRWPSASGPSQSPNTGVPDPPRSCAPRAGQRAHRVR
jgi:hypothetical protein